MHTTKYLIVGAGMTGDMAAKGIREHDADGSITMIGADPHPPYKRPLLTKGLWQGAPEEKLWRDAAEGVELVTGRRIVSLDLARAHRDGRRRRGVRATRSSCSRPARSRARSRRRRRASSTTARSTTTAACARSRRRARTSS